MAVAGAFIAERLRPADLAVMGPNLMDGRRRGETFEHSLRSTRRAMERSEFA
ncbi:hypothetical protein J2W56_005041 [Nocardia kruczakiae]|uniref:Uncharacterized protein n=1 Tax=Nocardia kruczakiae TaxID=261477 RepID=A0ABU1XMS9_9NOCA|nr:hypothetical protein [Nocardia kruczakiae]